jgi:hypothetical protein
LKWEGIMRSATWKTTIPLLLTIAAAVAVSVALSNPTGAQPSTTPDAPERAGESRIAPHQGAPNGPHAQTVEAPLAIHEAHSDGGYWYWLERQPAERHRAH